MRSLTRWLALCGVASAGFYVAGTAVALLLRPDYSLLTDTVSRLGETGARGAGWFVYLGTAPSGLLTVAFAIALYHALGTGWVGRAGAALVALNGLLMLATFAVFPRNTWPAMIDVSVVDEKGRLCAKGRVRFAFRVGG